DKKTNGCEINLTNDKNNCGTCGTVCSMAVANPTCNGGSCNGDCAPGTADCDRNKQANGCEVNTTNDPANCGACAIVCSNNNIANPACTNAVCNGDCNPGTADCNN